MYDWIILLALAQEPVKKYPEWECVRWAWTGDVYNRRVVCVEWTKPPPKDKDAKKNA